MGVKVKSYKAPTTKITSKEIHFQLFVLATFSVKTKELFTLKFVSCLIEYFNFCAPDPPES